MKELKTYQVDYSWKRYRNAKQTDTGESSYTVRAISPEAAITKARRAFLIDFVPHGYRADLFQINSDDSLTAVLPAATKPC